MACGEREQDRRDLGIVLRVDHALPAAPSATPPKGPFTLPDLELAGLDRSWIRRSQCTQVFRGIWVRRTEMEDDTRIRAALLLHPEGAIASHFSAARIYRLPVPDHPFEHVTVFHPGDRRPRPGLKSHVTCRPRRVRRIRGIPTLDPISTFIQLAGSLSLVDLVVLGDALVQKHGIRPARLVEKCRSSGDYYAARATDAARLVRAGVDSPMETRLRLLLVLAGLPEPEVGKVIRNEDGSWRRRFDLYYDGARLIVEYDGRQHAESIVQWNSDLERREEFDADGLRILIVTAKGIYVEPARTLERVRRTLIERGVRGLPPINDEWREHFPGR